MSSLSWLSGSGSADNYDNRAAMATAEAAKEVGVLAAAVGGTSGALAALAAYNNAKDPEKGMPTLGPLGLDTIVGAAGLLAAVFGGDALGELGQTIALGVGLGGVASVGQNYGAAIGHRAATKGFAGAFDGSHDTPEITTGGHLSPEAQAVYEQYAGR